MCWAEIGVALLTQAVTPKPKAPPIPAPAPSAPTAADQDVAQAGYDQARALQVQRGLAYTMTNGGTGDTSKATVNTPSLQSQDKKTVLGT